MAPADPVSEAATRRSSDPAERFNALVQRSGINTRRWILRECTTAQDGRTDGGAAQTCQEFAPRRTGHDRTSPGVAQGSVLPVRKSLPLRANRLKRANSRSDGMSWWAGMLTPDKRRRVQAPVWCSTVGVCSWNVWREKTVKSKHRARSSGG
jgi:hypothetical protein